MANSELDILRRIGILPMNPGDTDAAIPDFPVINMGQEFGPKMEAELTQPQYFPQPRQTGVEDATSSSGGQPAAPVESGTLPWKQTTSQGIGMPELSQVLQIPIQSQPGGQQSIQAPEGTASWQRANPADTQSWLAAQTARQTAERQAGVQAAENAATVEVGQQREVERQKSARQALQQRLMREVAMRNPAQAAQLMQQQQTAGQLTAAQAAQGSPESQAFRQILTTQGLPAALAWIQQNHAQKQGPLTPEQRYQNTLAETLGRFGPGAQGARAATAGVTSTARAEGAQAPSVPLTPTEAGKAGLPVGTTRGEVAGKVLTTPAQREKATELDTGRFMLDSISKMADELITANDPGSALVQGLTLKTGSVTRANTTAAVFEDQRKSLLGILSRQIGAERGVLTDRDIERLDTALPKFRDTKDVKDQKIAFLKGMFDVTRGARIKAQTALLGPSAPTQQQSEGTKTVGGTTYYKIGGKWFDNPEGR